MTRLTYAAILSLFGAGIVHIAILMLLPYYTERDAWSLLSQTSEHYTVTRIGGSGATTPLVRSVDPLFAAVACRFDLDDGVVHVHGDGTVPFWSMSNLTSICGVPRGAIGMPSRLNSPSSRLCPAIFRSP